MLTVKPEQIKFEGINDVVDYVSLGLPPTKDNYEKLRNSIGSYPISDGSNIKISKGAFIEMSREDLQTVLDRVYADNCRNRNMLLGICGVIGIVAIGSIFSANKKKKNEEE